MALLVMDTATEVLSVGISENQFAPNEAGAARVISPTAGGGSGGRRGTAAAGDLTLLAGSASRVPRGHSRLLQPAIAQLFEQTGLGPKDLSAIGVGVGPGSYTGVRLGVSTAKAMAFALQIPVYPLSTLAAMAAAVVPSQSPACRVLSLLYARRGRAFGAVYERTDSVWEQLLAPQVLSMADWTATMNGIRVQRGHVEETVIHDFRVQHQLQDAVEALGTPRVVTLPAYAGNFAQGLATAWLMGDVPKLEGADLHTLKPMYALEVEAEVKLKEATDGGHAEK